MKLKDISDEDLVLQLILLIPNCEGYKITKTELLSRLEAGEKAIALIGTAPEGSHPDEQKPRDETWHKERQNWISEVEKLRLNIGLKKGN